MLMTIARASPIACLKCPQRAVNTTHCRCATALLWVERVYREGSVGQYCLPKPVGGSASFWATILA